MSTANQTQDAGAPAGRYPLAAAAVDAPIIARGDWRALRENANANLAFLTSGADRVRPDGRSFARLAPATWGIRDQRSLRRACLRCRRTNTPRRLRAR